MQTQEKTTMQNSWESFEKLVCWQSVSMLISLKIYHMH